MPLLQLAQKDHNSWVVVGDSTNSIVLNIVDNTRMALNSD